MDEATIPTTDEETVRMGCLDGAFQFYELTGTQPVTPDDVIDLAACFEHYVTAGATVTVQCFRAIESVVR